jgi:MFS family permease
VYTAVVNTARDDDETSRVIPSGGEWRSLLLIGGMLGVTQLGYYLTASALPLYLHDLGAAQNRIGFEVGLGNIVGVVVMLALGPALNRHGAKIFLRSAALLYLLAAAGMLVFRAELPVTAFRGLQGVGSALILPASMTLAARLVPHRQGAAMGAVGTLNALALAAGPPIGLTLYARYGGTGLLVPALSAAALGLVAVFLVPGAPPTPTPARGFGFDRAWTSLIVANGLAAIYFGGIVAYLPLNLRALHGPNAGIFFTADAIGVLLLRIPTGILVDRRGALIPMVLGLAITLPGIGVLALPPSIVTLALSGAMTGIGAGLFITGVYTDLASRSSDANRGTAMSMSSASFGGAIFVGSAVSGLLIGPGGFNAVLTFGAITCALALPFAVIRPSRRR